MASYAITVPLGKALGMGEPSARLFLSLFLGELLAAAGLECSQQFLI